MIAVYDGESVWFIIVQRVMLMTHMLTVSYESRYIVSGLTVVILARFVLPSRHYIDHHPGLPNPRPWPLAHLAGGGAVA